MAYVSEYGNYGAEEVVTFGEDLLTAEQWENLDILPDNERITYVKLILEGEDVSGFEE